VRRSGKGHCDCNGGKGRQGQCGDSQRSGSKDLRGGAGRRQVCVGMERVTVTVTYRVVGFRRRGRATGSKEHDSSTRLTPGPVVQHAPR